MKNPKPCHFIGSSEKDLLEFPEDVRSQVGHALYVAQLGGKVSYVKPLKGFGSGVLEVVDDFDGDTYRAV